MLLYLIEKYKLPLKIIGQAVSGDEAIQLINTQRPDIVFLDIEMPQYNGIEVMEKIKASYLGMINFIIITAYSYFNYAQAALRLGAKDILLKPIEPEQFIEMMERVMKYRYTDNPSLNNILEYINNNYEKCLELNECANMFHVNSNYLTRMFKKHIGVSFITYVNEVRIKKAMELLKEEELSIKEVVQMVGYNNINYFYRNFKMIAGITPKMFKSNDCK